ncbi:RusA family crossover junction endodeoxyribonuclease [Streptomyces longispororuber]|uniref:RusA family crossover junction endodeoxyribonuclease n=1 Tax=Streptomyces longispororuber TaxID=68230 RepID=UPI00210DE05F|nr:RusA family crossover junction endodeoxyribonuclease [Streptomyces longispororuber]MCQ4208339.1 RusA family crossover junction endodeoxyribonuclease [Streptomyces longispororuber]
MSSSVVTQGDFDVQEFRSHGRVDIRSTVDPISLQASPVRKAEFKAALGSAVQKATRGIFTHDVEVTLVWFLEESRRYQTHLVADLDNVLKPILDAVTGPVGIMIDDNQIQSIRASWMTPGPPTGFELQFAALMGDDYQDREGLSFVEFSADRCYSLPQAEPSVQASLVRAYGAGLAEYRKMLDAGVSESEARMVLPIARPFPRARLGKFEVAHHTDF